MQSQLILETHHTSFVPEKRIYEGRSWIRLNDKTLRSGFRFPLKQTKAALNKLVALGVIEISYLDQPKWYGKRWFAIDYERLKQLCPNSTLGDVQ